MSGEVLFIDDHRYPETLKLHKELDTEYMDDEDMETLRSWGMKESISRDILAPAASTLHVRIVFSAVL